MLYQLIHHDGKTSELVSQSPDLKTEDDRDAWYSQEIFRKVLPEGRTWAIVDQNHQAYKQSATASVKSEQTFDEILAEQKVVWRQRQEEKVKEQEEFAAYLKNYRKRR